MDIKNQNIFRNQLFQKQMGLKQNSVPLNITSNLKAMSMDPTKKNEVLSTLTRFQNQISTKDYNEILANVKSMNGQKTLETKEETLETKQEITTKDYQHTVSDLKRLEREMRFR